MAASSSTRGYLPLPIRGSLKVNETTNWQALGRNSVNAREMTDVAGIRMSPSGIAELPTITPGPAPAVPARQDTEGDHPRSSPEALRRALGTMTRSLIVDVDHYLERLFGETRDEPLSTYEFGKIVPRLQACLWSLMSDALRQANGYPDPNLKITITLACCLDAESYATGFEPTDPFARRLAGAVRDFRDLAASGERVNASAGLGSSEGRGSR
ncbi:hypothetical protein ABZV77_05230 [Streptomyces sp. NPDC004732]|uniref:hypothetical protein n=1 Tax=Streptomyces sp. NPDC004732 TaxID=3154290 RepID=UPI0033AED732